MTRPLLCQVWMCPGLAVERAVYLNPRIGGGEGLWLCAPCVRRHLVPSFDALSTTTRSEASA